METFTQSLSGTINVRVVLGGDHKGITEIHITYNFDGGASVNRTVC